MYMDNKANKNNKSEHKNTKQNHKPSRSLSRLSGTSPLGAVPVTAALVAPGRARRIPTPAGSAAARAQPRLPHVVMAGGLDGEVGCSRNLGAAAGTVEAGTPGGKRKCNGKPRSFSRSFGGVGWTRGAR